MSLRREAKLALARWAAHKRRGWLTAQAVRPGAQDEAMHPTDGRRRFAEDHTFVGVAQDLAFLARLEWLPGRGLHRVWVVLLGPDQTWSCPPSHTLHAGTARDAWAAGGMELDCLEPLKRWSIRFRGPLVSSLAPAQTLRSELQLEFVGEFAPYVPGVDDDPDLVADGLGQADWDAQLIRGVRRVTQRGYVQLGRVGGRLAIGDRVIPIRTHGLRQHTWGVRDWGAAVQAVQCFATDQHHQVWIQRAQFPQFDLESGFVAHRGGVASMRALEHTGGRPSELHLRVRLTADLAVPPPQNPWSFAGHICSSHELAVDGRGAVNLSLVQAKDGACGLWAQQRRTLPWPGPTR